MPAGVYWASTVTTPSTSRITRYAFAPSTGRHVTRAATLEHYADPAIT